jgi:hypothetical protein
MAWGRRSTRIVTDPAIPGLANHDDSYTECFALLLVFVCFSYHNVSGFR